MSLPRRRPHVPSRGDICRVDLEPGKSRQEFGKYRPCLVISATDYNKQSDTCVFVPLTTKDENPSAFTIPVPAGLIDAETGEELRGLIACDHPRSIAYRRRECRFVCHIDDQKLLADVISTLLDLIDPV